MAYPLPPATVSVERITKFEDFLALKSDWDELAATSPNPLLSHDWFRACLTAFDPDAELAVFAARAGGRLRAVAPLLVERSLVGRRLRLIGHQTMEPEAFLFDHEPALEAACAAALASRLPLALRRLDDEGAELRALQGLGEGRGLQLVRPGTTQTHTTVFAGNWAATEAAMPSRKRAVINKQRRYLEKEGAVQFEVLDVAEERLDEVLEEFIQVEAASWKSRTATALKLDQRLRRFLRDFAAAASRAGKLRVSFLRLNGRAIASQIDVEQGGRLWGLKSGADEAWSKFGPGVLCFHELARWGAERGLSGREHLGRAEGWQTRWPYEKRGQSSFRFYPARPLGVAVFVADAVEVARRKLAERLQAPAPPAKVSPRT
jgi:CelD/BcsL family acetyltransferase involved in cellulose biosynthesis